MATLITVSGNRGIVGRCDSKYHDAVGEICRCVCGGANHGVGLSRAIENTKELANKKIKENTARLTREKHLKVKKIIEKQSVLFDLLGP